MCGGKIPSGYALDSAVESMREACELEQNSKEVWAT